MSFNSIPNVKNNYIILTKNIINSSNIGNLLYIKENIIQDSNDLTSIFANVNNNNIDNKNRIILSGKIDTTSCCLITQNNIKNNMKFIFDASTNSNGKILFTKNLNIADNGINYLFKDLNNTYFENNTSNNINNINNIITNNRYIYHLNYYVSKSDIYKINISNYLYKYISEITSNGNIPITNNDIDYNTLGFKIINISNDFYFINTTIDSSSIINFNSNNFNKVLIDNIYNTPTIGLITPDTSLNILQNNTDYSIHRNMWSYNKFTLDFKHNNYYEFNVLYDFSSSNTTLVNYSSLNLNNNIIKTFLIKTNNFNTLQNIKKNSKIVFGSRKIIINNVKVLDRNSNLYSKDLSFNNSTKNLATDFSNLILLGLGNQVTGITQSNIYRHVHLTNDNSIMLFQKDVNTSTINNYNNFITLRPNLNKNYLLDISLNYTNYSNDINYDNSNYNINNTIKFNSILYYIRELQTSKVFNINFNNFFNAITNNYFKNSFNNLARLNDIDYNIYSASPATVNGAINIKFKNFNKDPSIKLNNINDLLKKLIPLNADQGYDLRFNYSQIFNLNNNLDIIVSLETLNLTRNSEFDFTLLNFYSFKVENYFRTSGGSDFTNVDCIYIYHDPINDPDPKYRYPNNNIEIKFDNDIDTLTKAIEQYRGTGARTSTTNAAFIPSQNGSNLSRKMIQGIIGLNNIPKLLSIEPYDKTFIDGRGFINQYQISDICITSNCDKIAAKQNAIKHESAKNSRTFISNSLKKQNFANIVKSKVRNKFSQECIRNLQSTNLSTNNVININVSADPYCNNVVKYTPLVMFNTGKGRYIGS